MNIALLLEMAADAAPDRIALVCEGKRWSRVPERILFVPNLPYNEMGKLLRREVKTVLAG